MKAQLCDAELDYLVAKKEERGDIYEIQKAKQKLGYVLPIEVEEAHNQCVSVQLQIEMVKDQNQLYFGKQQEGKLDNALMLFEKGKIAEIQLAELKTELTRLQYERISLIVDAKTIYYILTHTMEGQE